MSDLFRRIRRATRASLNDLKRRTFGSEDKSLSELSDAELEEELLRRRRRRARGRSGGAPRREDDTPQAKQVLQWYANLELEPGASLEEIEGHCPIIYSNNYKRHAVRAFTDLSPDMGYF